jgi:pimeloyl-ACP methyl ester carboxylesterase
MNGVDVVIVLPGIMGSQLRRNGQLVWGPSAGAALRAITTFGRSLQHLQLPPGIGDDDPVDGVQPAGLMPDLHVLPGIWTPVKGYDRLLGKLRSLGYRDVTTSPGAPPGNLLPLAYDWRLSCRRNGQHIASTIEQALDRWQAQGGPYKDAQLVFVCHSMGGLVARWYIEHCGGAAHTRKLITFGTPYRGAAKALGQLVNGIHPGLGPLGINLTSFARSLPSLYQLLPEYACIEHSGGLAKTTETPIPFLDTTMTADAMRFYTQLQDAEQHRPASLQTTHAIIGTRQPTATTMRITADQAHPVTTYQGDDLGGDATVPLPAACRTDVPMDSPLLRRVPDKHGNLHRNRAALDELEGILTAQPVTVRAAPATTGLAVGSGELILAGQPLTVTVQPPEGQRVAVRVAVTSETGHLTSAQVIRPPATATIDGLPPGAYTIDVTGLTPTSPIAPVTSTTLVWDPRLNNLPATSPPP